ncbi:MAG: FAD-dependent oxidoreductase [Firmicutes bacterium]|nr:FAD-dependent oxidoreductase [Bacillota bacterium]
MKTIWERSEQKKFDQLQSDIKCDVAIIGGGIAGLMSAFHLVKAGKRVCILEANRIGSGVTAGSTAILTYAQDVIYRYLIRKHGKDAASKYLNDSQNAIKEIKNIVEKEKFDCDFEAVDFVLFSTKYCGKKSLMKEVKAYKELGHEVEQEFDPGLPYKVAKSLRFKGNYQFNPLKLCDGLANYITQNGGQIFEKTLVKEAPNESHLKIGEYTVFAENFIVATHFPYINLPGFFWLKMFQHQNYCIAFNPPSGFENFAKGTSYESIDKTGFEYRRVGEAILCDGASVRVGQKPYKSKYQILEQHIEKHFDSQNEIVRYCSQDCITMDKLPYAGRYSHFVDNVFVTTGFNKWGMTNSYICAKVVTDMILGKLDIDAPFDENIYTPQRIALVVNPVETVTNVATIAASFANDILNVDAKKFERIGAGQGAIIKYKGKRVGASREDDGTLNLISGICPHLGCNLKWNKDERTFDCPCHGSRFDTKGKIINNPATEPAKRIKIE